MSIKDDIIAAFDSYSTLTALVGNRNYWRQLPQEPAYPNTVTHRVTTNPLNTLSGTNQKSHALFQTDIRGTSEDSAEAVARAVIGAMEAATTFKALLLDQHDNPFEDLTDTNRIIIDFSIRFIDSA